LELGVTERFSCGLEAALYIVSGKWKPLILMNLSAGRRRYGELRRSVTGISDKVLIQQLKELQGDLTVNRIDFGEIPPRVEYELSEFGESLAKAFLPICDWGERHRDEIETIASSDRLTPSRSSRAPLPRSTSVPSERS
jgi:DNA-binding HxlR family transcriptional regulator